MVGEKKSRYFGKEIIDEVKEMVSRGMTQRQIAEHFGLKDKYVIKELLKRDRRKERRIAENLIYKDKGPLRRVDLMSEKSKDNEIKKLRMEVDLLRSFLQIAGRK